MDLILKKGGKEGKGLGEEGMDRARGALRIMVYQSVNAVQFFYAPPLKRDVIPLMASISRIRRN